jgi:hypothetical protein
MDLRIYTTIEQITNEQILHSMQYVFRVQEDS